MNAKNSIANKTAMNKNKTERQKKNTHKIKEKYNGQKKKNELET